MHSDCVSSQTLVSVIFIVVPLYSTENSKLFLILAIYFQYSALNMIDINYAEEVRHKLNAIRKNSC